MQILISRFGGPGPILFAGVSNGSVRLSTRYVGVVFSLTLSAFDGCLTDGRWRMSYEGWSRTPLTEQIAVVPRCDMGVLVGMDAFGGGVTGRLVSTVNT